VPVVRIQFLDDLASGIRVLSVEGDGRGFEISPIRDKRCQRNRFDRHPELQRGIFELMTVDGCLAIAQREREERRDARQPHLDRVEHTSIELNFVFMRRWHDCGV